MSKVADPGMSEEAVLDGTAQGWAHWLAVIDATGGRDMSHAEIAAWLRTQDVPGWWCQMVAVGYERMIGRRAVGQRCDGEFAASASKTYAGDKDEALAAWLSLVAERTEFAGALATSEPRVTQSEKWRYWRVDLEGGSRATVHFSDKAAGKATIGVDHQKLASKEAADEAKAFWKSLFAMV